MASSGIRQRSAHVAQTIVMAGDSFSEQGGMIPAAPQIKPTSPWPWAMSLLGQRFKVLANTGIGGQTTAQILARFDTDVLALDSGWIHLLAGTNDVGVDVEAAKANILTMLGRADRAGKRVVLGTIPPRITPNYSGTQKVDTLELNRWIIDTARPRPNVIVADYFSALSAPDGTYRATIAGWNPTSDGTHLSAAGGFAAGRVLADALADATAPAYPFTPFTGAGLNLVPNADFTIGAAASVPTSWTTSGAGAASITWSSVPRPALPGTPWKQAVIPNAAGTAALQCNATVGANGLAVGDTLNAYIEYELAGLDQAAITGQQAFYLAIKFWNGAAYTSSLSALESTTSPNADRSGALFVPDVAVPAGTTIVTTEVTMYGGGTYRLGRAGLYEAAVFS